MKLWDDSLEGLREEARALLENIESWEDDVGALPDDPWEQALAMRASVAARLAAEAPVSAMAVNRTIAGPSGELPVRMFVPDSPRGMLLHIHGGGWILGSPIMGDIANEHMARAHGLTVVSVDYRLAPEHPYPAGTDDCETAARWMLDHGPTEWGVSRLLLGGESAGAQLALTTMLRLRDRHHAIDRVLGANLVFGCFDLRGTPSVYDNGGRFDMLSTSSMLFMVDTFVGAMSPAERRDPDVSPLFADLGGLPPCLVSVGTYDHLLDDSLFLAARLAAAESPVELAVYPDSPHGFVAMPTKMAGAHYERVDAWTAALLD